MKGPIAISAALFFAAMTAIAVTQNDKAHDCQLYNEMRSIWDESQGAYGWPQYQAGKDEECDYES